jgi:hypothetical protein
MLNTHNIIYSHKKQIEAWKEWTDAPMKMCILLVVCLRNAVAERIDGGDPAVAAGCRHLIVLLATRE